MRQRLRVGTTPYSRVGTTPYSVGFNRQQIVVEMGDGIGSRKDAVEARKLTAALIYNSDREA